MKKKILNISGTYGFLVVGGIIIFLCIPFILLNLQATFLYEKAVSGAPPSLQLEKEGYYRQTLSLLSKAISLRKDNADFYKKKADYLLQARGEGMTDILDINPHAIEKLYRKAIELNPVDFENHLKLGWFYQGSNNEQAETQLKKAARLSPLDYQVYLSLSKYYFRMQQEWPGFTHLLLALHYYYDTMPFGRSNWLKFMKQISSETENLSHVAISFAWHWRKEKRAEVRYTALVNADEYDFKKQNFPHAQIPLKIGVYIKEKAPGVTLYKNSIPYQDFIVAESTAEHILYELNIDTFPPGAYLDDFSIKTKGASLIRKIEIIKEFNYQPRPKPASR